MAGESMSEPAEDATGMIKVGDTTAKDQSPLVCVAGDGRRPLSCPAWWGGIPTLSLSSVLDPVQFGSRRVALAQLGVCKRGKPS